MKLTSCIFRLRLAAFALAVVVAPGVAWAHKVKVASPATAKSLEERGGQLLADYGSFRVYEVPRLPPNLKQDDAAEVCVGWNQIRLAAARIDTTPVAAKAARKPVGNFPGKRLHLIQFLGTVQPAWRVALEQTGAQIVSYLPENAYLVYGDDRSLAQLPEVPAAQWDGVYQDYYKIHPTARLVDEKGAPRQLRTELFAVQLVGDAEANPVTLAVLERLKLAPIRRQFNFQQYRNVVVRLRPQDLDELARQPDVVSIQPYAEPKKLDERQTQIMAGNLTGISPSGPGYLAWLAGKGFSQEQFTASGFAIDISDSGLDNGTTAPGHFALRRLGDPNNTSRVIYNRLEGVPNNPGSTLQGCDGHGTLNAHIAVGYDASPAGFPHTDNNGFYYGLGVCPFVKVGSSVIFDPNTFTNPSYPNLLSKAYHDGARISNNSWGLDTSSGYNIDSQIYDALVRDAQPAGATFAVTGNQEMVIIFSDGDDGPTTGTITAPGTAKNVFTVGSSENVRSMNTANGGGNSFGKDGCDTLDADADSADDIAIFSGRGPCSDGRIKPDLVAPGSHITGGAPQVSPSPSPASTGLALPCFNGEGVCGLPGSTTAFAFFPSGQQFFTESSGTSHSAPAVAGACALLRQDFINHSLTPPSPAMTKAYLMNSARYLTGVSANDNLWSIHQGMGALNLGMALDGVARLLRDQLTADKFTATGQTRTFTGTVADPAKPFRVTVAWTDAPGSTAGNALNNDLDLTVTMAGQTYKGNVFSRANSVGGGAADHRNNVESVFLPAGTTGNFTVTLTAANINSDGVPGNADATDQDFALVIYNGMIAPAANLIAAGSAILGETCSPTDGVIDPGEIVTVSFSLANIGTAATGNLVATLLPTGGVTAPSGPQTYGVVVAGGAAATRSFSFTANGSCGGAITNTLQLQDGTIILGTVTFVLPLGKRVAALTENFENGTGLPGGWSTSATGAQSPWTITGGVAFSPAPGAVGVNELVTPAISIASASAQLTFRQSVDLEASAANPGVAYDGGVLEIKMGSGAFADILSSGGSFVAGGYDHVITNSHNNPLAGRAAWSGDSQGFVTTVVNLPAAAPGQTIQLRWRCGTDKNVSKTGWYMDSIAVTDPICCGGSCQFALAPTNASYSANGGTGIVTVVATGSQCAWTSTSDAGFLTINTGASGAGNATINYTVAANPAANSRIGTLTIAGQSFLVTQAGIPPTPQLLASPTVTNAGFSIGPQLIVAAGVTNVFAVAAAGNGLLYQWVFGDGTTSDSSGLPTAGHAYETNCTGYTATVTVSDGLMSTSGSVVVSVAWPVVTTKLQVKPNFAKPNADQCILQAVFAYPCAVLNSTGQVVTVAVGGAGVEFTLDKKGRGVNPQGTCRLAFNRPKNRWTLTANLRKGMWQDNWAFHGLLNATIPRPGIPVSVPVVLLIGDAALAAQPVLHYTAQAGKSGVAK